MAPGDAEAPSGRRAKMIWVGAAVIVVAIIVIIALAAGLGGGSDGQLPKDYGFFEGKQRFEVDDLVPVSIHRSTRSGMTVVSSKVVQPKMEGALCLVTEAFDDDGLPHTLEHLVFMGSKKYPYKGSLDMIANRCLASGTNAWTEPALTCYTMTTAGSEGFFNLLPVFLDHILNPTLNDSFFITEVYHVDGAGQDGGVVFSEMRAKENEPFQVIARQGLELLYPGQCGFKSETGGRVPNLRYNTTNVKVLDYHRRFYRPENLVVIVAGDFDADKLFGAIEGVDAEEAAKEREPFERPFTEPCEELDGDIFKRIEYPSDDEKFGMVALGWRMPDPRPDFYLHAARMELVDYLLSGVTSPLEKFFVQRDPPLATAIINFWYETPQPFISLIFKNVPVSHLDSIRGSFFEVMENVTRDDFDLKRMREIIKSALRTRKSRMENTPFYEIRDATFSFAYDDDMENVVEMLNFKTLYEKMLKEDEEFWRELLKEILSRKSMVSLVGKPSKRRSDELVAEEKKLFADRVARIGPDGLAEKARVLKEAKEKNDVGIPREILESIPIPSVDSVKLPFVESVRNKRLEPGKPAPSTDFDEYLNAADLPFAAQISNLDSSFVELTAFVRLGDAPIELKRYIPLLVKLIFNTDVKRGSRTVSYEEIVDELQRDTAQHYLSYRTSDINGWLQVYIKVEKDKLEKGLQYLKEALFDQVFRVDRIQHYQNAFKNSLPAILQNAYHMTHEVFVQTMFRNDSDLILVTMAEQSKLAKQVEDDLENNNGLGSVAKLNELVAYLKNPSRLIVHLSGNITDLSEMFNKQGRDLKTVLKDGLDAFADNSPMETESRCSQFKPLSYFLLDIKPGTRMQIVSMSSIEAGNLGVSSPLGGALSQEEEAACKVVESYLNMMEGPVWKQIRGLGLAYNFHFSFSRGTGTVRFDANRVSNVMEVYKEMRRYFTDFAVDEMSLQSARSTFIFELIDGSDPATQKADSDMLNCFRGRPYSYIKDLMDKAIKVSAADVERVVDRRLRPLFNGGNVSIIVAANPSKVDGIVEGFETLGVDVTRVTVESIVGTL